MASRRRQEGGKKPKAEGRHGDVTHEALQQQLRHKLTTEPIGPDEPGGPAPGRVGDKGNRGDPESLKAHVPGPDGRHRLDEDRQQHDEADKNSEKNRAARKAGGHSGDIK